MTLLATDPDLLRRFRLGDRAALSKVYWFYVARVEGAIRRGLLAMGRHDAGSLRADTADLVQEVFVRAFGQPTRQNYDGTREYAPFLMGVARHVLTDHFRRRGRQAQLEQMSFEEMPEPDAGEDVDEEPWADSQTVALVERYVAGLSGQEHAVYVQRFAEGRSQLQTADALGLTRQQVRTLEGHVRSGLTRALARARLAASSLPVVSLAPTRQSAFAALGGEDD